MEPLNKGHSGITSIIHYREVVLISEVKLVCPLYKGCPYLGGSFIRRLFYCCTLSIVFFALVTPYRFIVLSLLHHLGSQVVKRPTERGAPGGGGVDGPAKVRNLDVSLHADKQVLWFDVPVDHLLGVAVDEGVSQLSYVLHGRGGERKGRWWDLDQKGYSFKLCMQGHIRQSGHSDWSQGWPD